MHFACARDGSGEICFGDRGIGNFAAGEFVDDTSAGEYQHPVANTLKLNSVGGGNQYRQALVGDGAQPLIDLAARADVDAFGRFVYQKHSGFRRNFAAEQRLLLVAAG